MHFKDGVAIVYARPASFQIQNVGYVISVSKSQMPHRCPGSMACDSRQNSTLNSVLHTFHFVTQIVFCILIVKIKFYFVFQILFCFELCSLNSVLSPKFYFVFQILFCFELCSLNSVLSPKFYFVFQILFCFELCSLNSVLSPKFYSTLKWQFA